MLQYSLVCLYMEKTPEFSRYIERINHHILDSGIGWAYKPYHIKQAHATLTGIERVRIGNTIVNRNILQIKGVQREMHPERIKELLEKYLPMQIRLAGFDENDRSFTSRNDTPYKRTFGISTSNGQVVIIGWPWQNNTVSYALQELRDQMEIQCGIGHKYADDNDFYMVLGRFRIPGTSDAREVRKLEYEVRERLGRDPIEFILLLDNIMLVRYTDERLPIDKTGICSMNDVEKLKEWMRDLIR